jgi:transcriptional regulator with XRE-family HTH domain
MKRRTPQQVVADVGHRIRELRDGLGLTQQAIAEQLGMSIQYFRRVETGRVNVSVYALAEFARALGVEPGGLLERPARRVRPKRGRPKKRGQPAQNG